MPNIYRVLNRLKDLDDVAPLAIAGNDGKALLWDQASNAFVMSTPTPGNLLTTGASVGATSQAQAFTNGIVGGTAANEDLTIEGTLHATKTTSFVNIQPSGGKVGIGTTTPPDSLLHVSNSLTANTSTVQQLLTLSANSTGTAAAGFGSRILWELESSTTDDQTAAALDVQWSDATHATKRSYVNLQTVVSGTLTRLLHNYSNATATGRNIFVGLNAGNFTLSPLGGSSDLASYNAGFGYGTLKGLTTGSYNTGIGYSACEIISSGADNVGIGAFSNQYLTTGNNNTSVGSHAGYTNSTGSSSVFMGYRAGYYETASNKLFIDNTSRANEDDGRAKALVYGVFAATTAAQTLALNAVVTISDGLTVTTGNVVLNENGDATADFRVESDTEANMLFVDANANTDGSIYLGGTTNGIEIQKGGDLTLLGTAKYERHVQLVAKADGTVANQPTQVDFFTAGGLQYATTGTKNAFCEWEIPDDWDGTNVTFEVDWFPDSGATSGTDAVRWTVEYRSIAPGETINNGTSVTLDNGVGGDTADYAQYQTKHTQFTLVYNNANQPLTAQDHVYFKITRDTAVANDFGGSVTVTAYEIIYNSKGFPTSN